LCDVLESSFFINQGGCCYIAYVIAKNLEKLNIPYKVVLCDEDIVVDEKDYYYGNIKKRSRKGIIHYEYSFNHVYLTIDDMAINYVSYLNDNPIELFLNSKDLFWIYKKGDWNRVYDSKLNPKIYKIINLFISSINYEKE
jgi:hypothetical protein